MPAAVCLLWRKVCLMHPNDTLNGKLFEFEIEEEKHLRGNFGYWRMVEDRMIREKLIKQGHDPADRGFLFLVSREREANHANDVPYRASVITKVKSDKAAFNAAELEYMADMFRDANHPLAQSIYEKAIGLLK